MENSKTSKNNLNKSPLPSPPKKIIETIKRSNGKLRILLHTGSESYVQSAYKDECDVNRIMEKFNRTGLLPQLINSNPRFGDFSEVPDFQEAQNIIATANSQFAALPAKLRDRFRNDPAEFLAFVHDEKNKGELAELGLLKPEAVERLKAPKKGLEDAPKAPAEDKNK